MRPDVLLLDCYGTLVEGDRPVIEAIVAEAARRTGVDPDLVDRPWWERFAALCAEASGAAFRTQHELEVVALGDVLAQLGSPLPRAALIEVLEPLRHYWRTAAPYPDAIDLLDRWTISPVVIVSNIDRADIDLVVRRLPPVHAVVTSEDVRAYKPDARVFRTALDLVGVPATRAIHVGDSWTSDVLGAQGAGITDVVHVVRDRPDGSGPDGVRRLTSLTPLLDLVGA